MRSFTFVTASIWLSLVACRGGSDSKNPDGNVGGDGPSNTVTIQMVQSDSMAPGTAVSLSGVIVTTVDNYGAKTGDFWVEEPEGGPQSGVHVFKADPTVVATLQPGDIVSVTNAQKAAFTYMTDMTGRSEIELEPPMSGQMVTVTKTGTGTVPAPAVVDALAIGKMADANNNGDRSAAWKMWDGVLIKVSNVTETNSISQIGGKTPDPTLQKFDITGVITVESSNAAFPSSGLNFNACLGSVTGVVNYFLGYELLNTSTTDIVAGGSGCPVAEAGAQCTNTIDDDGNGFTDCSDNNCVVDQATCRTTHTISEVDMAVDAMPMAPTLPTGNPVGVEIGNGGNSDPYVTAISTSGADFWVSTNKAGAADNGLDVFIGKGAAPTGLAVGARVHLVGTLDAYNNDTQGEVLPELHVLQATVTAAPTGGTGGGITPAAVASVSTLTTASTGRPYVGSLVRLLLVKVVTPSDPANHNDSALQQGSNMFEGVGDVTLIDAATYPAGTCITTLDGVWTYDVYNNKYAIEPVTVTKGTGCP